MWRPLDISQLGILVLMNLFLLNDLDSKHLIEALDIFQLALLVLSKFSLVLKVFIHDLFYLSYSYMPRNIHCFVSHQGLDHAATDVSVASFNFTSRSLRGMGGITPSSSE